MSRNECGSGREATWEIERKPWGEQGSVRPGAKNHRKVWVCAIGTQVKGMYASVHVSEPVCVSGCEYVYGESGGTV